jgi:hypothetical protein
MNKKLEKQLFEEYGLYQAKAHPEDRLTFLDYVQQLGRFQGYQVTLRETWTGSCEYQVRFTK